MSDEQLLKAIVVLLAFFLPFLHVLLLPVLYAPLNINVLSPLLGVIVRLRGEGTW